MSDDIQVRLSWEDPGSFEPFNYVGRLPITLGRLPGNNLQLNSAQVSDNHARLDFENGAIILTDLNTESGTLVAGKRVPKAQLADGASFQIGPFTITLAILAPDELPDQITLEWNDEGGSQKRTLPIPASIGRAPTNTLQLASPYVSRIHAHIEKKGNQIVVRDNDSRSGIKVNDRSVKEAALKNGDILQLWTLKIRISFPDDDQVPEAGFTSTGGANATLFFSADDGSLASIIARLPDRPVAPTELVEPFPPRAFNNEIVSVDELWKGRVPLEEKMYLAIGGGIGSFIWVDFLRCGGVAADQIASIGFEPKPYTRYKRLAKNSQIPDYERLRSNSDSCPDNIWGFPSYGTREIFGSLRKGKLGNAIKVTWQLFGEPNLAQVYTPRAGDVFDSMDQEEARIGWDQIWRYGVVRAIRKTNDGRYAVAYVRNRDRNDPDRYRIILARFVHLAVGYPAVRFLRDLQAYREKTNDFKTVVNAYEDHDHVYQDLERNGGTVLIRGRGIVSSRILQRLYEARAKNKDIAVLHLMRSPNPEPARYRRTKRKVHNHWEFQDYNWPKAAWGGIHRDILERSQGAERDNLYNDWGGTTTAERPDWVHIVESGTKEGWYQIRFGDVARVEKEGDKIITFIRGRGLIQEETRIPADYIIDGTGLEAEIDANPLLADLVAHHDLKRNVKGRLHVENNFEVLGMRNGEGRMYAAGITTLGGPYAPVDSFLGLQYAALQSVDSLRASDAPQLKSLNGFSSLFAWLRWMRGVAP